MIFETLALSGLLYTGFKEFNKSRKENKSLAKTKTLPKTTMENRVAQMFKEQNNQLQKSNGNDGGMTQTFEKKEKREMAAASSAFVLSSIGFFYRPIGLFSIPFIMYASKDIFKNSYQLIKQGKVNVSTLMSITIAGCLMLGRFFAAALILVLVRLAMKLMTLVTQTSKQALVDIFEQQPSFVWIVVDNIETKISFNALKIGDIVAVHAGEVIPADGIIVEGIASIDQHILTGEARPIEKELGEEVFAATVILSGKIYIQVEKTGEECTAAKITKILNNTVDFKSTTQLRAQTLSERLVKPALVAGGIALPILGFNSAVAIIYTHPKNKMMGIAPATILNYLNLASQQGILIKDGRSFELLKQVDTIVFDKTGTLTEEQPHVGIIHCCSNYSEADILTYAGAAECRQNHPLAKAIMQEAENRQLIIPSIDESEYKVGYGLIVGVAGQTVHVGSERFIEMIGMTVPLSLKQQQQLSHEEGYTLVMVAVDNHVIGAIELLPTVRAEVKTVIRRLKRRGNIKAMYIISGDHETPTKKLAQELGIDHYFAETLPEKKADLIEQLQQEGHFICYIGDGINDSIALKKSQVSISLRGASTIATDTAQIVLMDNGLNHLELVFELADDFNANMNITFAIMLIPAIVGVSGVFLLGFGIPQIIALNMTGLVFAAGNAMTPLLKRPKNIINKTV
jgi:heavy metal translocating P-type ATPase